MRLPSHISIRIALAGAAWLTLPAMQTHAQTSTPASELSRQEFVERRALCAAEWEKMKRAGNEGSLTWRIFAESCMQRTDLHGQTHPQKENASPIR